MNETLPRYKYDLYCRLLAALLAACIVTPYGGNDSVYVLLLNQDGFYKEFVATLIISLLDVHAVFAVTRRLDKQFDWLKRPWERVLLQAFFGILLPTMATFLLASFYFSLYSTNILETDYQHFALPYIAALIGIFNLYYLIRYLLEKLQWLYQKWIEAQRMLGKGSALQQDIAAQMAVATAPEHGPLFFRDGHNEPALGYEAAATATMPNMDNNSTATRSVIIVHTPTSSIPIPVSDIAYFYRIDNRVYLRPFSGNDQILTQSLDALEEQLDREQFFRAARHMIVNRAAVKEFKSLLHGKLALVLLPIFKGKATVGKSSASKFRSWINR